MAASASPLPAKARRAIDRALRTIEAHCMGEDGAAFTDANLAIEYFRCRLGHRDREEFHACWLTAQHRLLAVETLFLGTIASTSVHPREVVKSALRHNAAAVIVAHNHPSGSPEPSAADRLLTTVLADALALVGVRLLDHIIVTNDCGLSMRARGLL